MNYDKIIDQLYDKYGYENMSGTHLTDEGFELLEKIEKRIEKKKEEK